jgi:hypothetical protein
MHTTTIAKRLFATSTAVLFAAVALAGGLAGPSLGRGATWEEQQPPKGPLGPGQAGPRKTDPPTATLGSAPPPGRAETYQATGTIRSLSDTALVLAVRSNGKETRKTFAVNADTKKEGVLKVGARAVVTYRTEGDKKVATRVAAAPRTSAPSKGKH